METSSFLVPGKLYKTKIKLIFYKEKRSFRSHILDKEAIVMFLKEEQEFPSIIQFGLFFLASSNNGTVGYFVTPIFSNYDEYLPLLEGWFEKIES